MIYIIIGHEKNTGNEFVHTQTFDTAVEAASLCSNLNDESTEIEYRVDTVEPTVYADTDSLHTTREFTKEELFPGNDKNDYFNTCSECGSVSFFKFLDKHTAWHNKLLP